MSIDIALAPLLPWGLIAGFALVAAGLVGLAMVRRARGSCFRAVAAVALVLAAANPGIRVENRKSRPDLAVVVVDRSPSQEVGGRRKAADDALVALREAVAGMKDVELRVVEAKESRAGEGTQLFAAVDRALADDTRTRLAAVVLITDGQVHDVPDEAASRHVGAPLHVILTGAPGERDRRLVVEQAPAYGLVGQAATFRVRVEDTGGAPTGSPAARAGLIVRRDGIVQDTTTVRRGEVRDVQVMLDHAGPIMVEIEVEGVDNELSTINNRAVVVVNAVRDRMRVLLISGQPHPGERMWRNFLKADPAVDLIHFTILRPPEKDEFAPLNELSLIAFPVQELFEEKIKDFDLVVFDRYVMRGILPWRYIERVAEYLENGGAVLLSAGPEFAGPVGLHQTPLGRLLPASPTGRVVEAAFRPELTDIGRRHPVTSTLAGAEAMGDADDDGAGSEPRWGRWFRLVETDAPTEAVLMSGREGTPLLVLKRVGDGRVAQLLSDQIWLWSRGFEGGGPGAELLRRTVHWLMKEPELEEERLVARIEGARLAVRRNSLSPDPAEVAVHGPDGNVQRLSMRPAADGFARAEVTAEAHGIYRIDDGERQALAASGPLDPKEFGDLRATAERLSTAVAASGGGVSWFAEGLPQIRRTPPGRDAAGRGWIGLRRNGNAVVTGATTVPMLPGTVVLAIVVASLAGAWWREGR